MEQEFFNSSLFGLSFEQLQALIPYLWLCLGIAVSIFGAGFGASLKTLRSLLLATLAPYLFLLFKSFGQAPQSVFGTSLEINAFSSCAAFGVGLLALVAGIYAKNDEENSHPEWAPLLLISTLGLSLIPAARDWGAFFVYLELASVPGYILAAIDTKRTASLEAGLKYLMMGAFSTAIFLMGVALYYGVAGDLDFASFAQSSSQFTGTTLLLASVAGVLLFAGLAFKVALVPFHMWAPDVYQGAPTALASYLASATKVSIFCGLIAAFEASRLWNLEFVSKAAGVIGILSVVVGSLLAIAQKQLRRMFAYSSVVNAGYVGLVVSLGAKSASSTYLYLLVYGLTVVALFAMLENFMRTLGKNPHGDIEISELSRLVKKLPRFQVALFILAIFSLSGIPPFPGFFTKYLLLKDLWEAGRIWESWTIVLGTLLGLAYYLRVLLPFFAEKTKIESEHEEPVAVSALAASLICVIILGLILAGMNGYLSWSTHVEGWAR